MGSNLTTTKPAKEESNRARKTIIPARLRLRPGGEAYCSRRDHLWRRRSPRWGRYHRDHRCERSGNGTCSGQSGPTFELPALDGGTSIAIQDFSGEISFLNFWASLCSPCRKKAPGLARVSRAYKDRGAHFLGADHRDDRAAARAFESAFVIPHPSVLDPSGSLARDYWSTGLPTTFIVGRRGQLMYFPVGYTNQELLRRAIEDALSDNIS